MSFYCHLSQFSNLAITSDYYMKLKDSKTKHPIRYTILYSVSNRFQNDPSYRTRDGIEIPLIDPNNYMDDFIKLLHGQKVSITKENI